MPDRYGPRTIMVPVLACDGCAALRHRDWTDEQGHQHTTAQCGSRVELHAGDNEITAYWRPGRPAPHWCPHRATVRTVSAPRQHEGPDVA